MKLRFSWQHVSGRLIADCSSDVVNEDGISILCCLLSDDGGQGAIDTLPWVDEGISLATKVASNEIAQAEWDRDAWGAKLSHDQVQLYSLHDEDYVQYISIESFHAALREWKTFLKIKPDVNAAYEAVV